MSRFRFVRTAGIGRRYGPWRLSYGWGFDIGHHRLVVIFNLAKYRESQIWSQSFRAGAASWPPTQAWSTPATGSDG